MRLDAPLDDLFASPSLVKVLRALVELPESFGVSAREIARRAGITHPTASKALGSLVEQGLATVKRSPRGDEYVFNAAHALADNLQSLFEFERSAPEDLRTFIARSIMRHAPGAMAAYLYGSAVEGSMSPGSDIDLAVVPSVGQGSLVETGMHQVAEEVKARYGNRLSVLMADEVNGATLGPITSRRLSSPVWRRIAAEGQLIRLSAPRKARRG